MYLLFLLFLFCFFLVRLLYNYCLTNFLVYNNCIKYNRHNVHKILEVSLLLQKKFCILRPTSFLSFHYFSCYHHFTVFMISICFRFLRYLRAWNICLSVFDLFHFLFPGFIPITTNDKLLPFYGGALHFTHTHKHTHIHIQTYNTHTYTYAHIHIHKHSHTYTHMHILTQIHT
jgi:hypothetical protein